VPGREPSVYDYKIKIKNYNIYISGMKNYQLLYSLDNLKHMHKHKIRTIGLGISLSYIFSGS